MGAFSKRMTLGPEWSMFAIIDKAAGGDITKYEQVCNLPYLTVLNQLVYHMYLDKNKLR